MGLIERIINKRLASDLENEQELNRRLLSALAVSERELVRVKRELETVLRENAALRAEQAQ